MLFATSFKCEVQIRKKMKNTSTDGLGFPPSLFTPSVVVTFFLLLLLLITKKNIAVRISYGCEILSSEKKLVAQ